MLQDLVKYYKNKNEQEALALSIDKPGAIFFTTDTNNIILNGKIFSIGPSRLFMGSQSDYEAAVSAGQIPYGTIVIIEETYLTFTALEDNCSIGFYNNPNSSITPTIEYSFDKNTWTVLTEDNITVPQNANMYCRGINPDGISGGYDDAGYNYFTGEGQFNVSGDIMSIINYETLPKTMVGTFYNLFGGEGASSRDNFVDIVDASGLILSATTLTSDCYANMFDSCTSMVYGPKIKAEILAPFCYYKMFYNCTSLTTAPELPATTLAKECYAYMFAYCTSLSAAPVLPATELVNSCYNYMFESCTSLTTPPELPATTLAVECYGGMFQNCTSLTTTPELPATTLADGCYWNMFDGCTALTATPNILPATTLANSCYQYMFRDCTSLTAAPVLPAATLTKYCYNNMFYHCTNLNYIKCLATDKSATNCTSNWVNGVSSTGTFVKHPNMTSWPTGSSSIPKGWTVEDADMSYVTFTAEEDGSSIGLERLSTIS